MSLQPTGRLCRRTAKGVTMSGLLKLAVVSSLLVGVAVPASAAIVREPYLQTGTPDSVTVVWRTDLISPSDSRRND